MLERIIQMSIFTQSNQYIVWPIYIFMLPKIGGAVWDEFQTSGQSDGLEAVGLA